MSQISVGRASGWGELHHVICDQCGWRSRPIDAVLEEGAWRRAKAHRCDQDEYAEEAEDELADEQQAQDDPVARPMIPEPTEADVAAARDELDQMETVLEQALSVAGTLGWAVLESTPGTHSTRVVALARAYADLCSTRAYIAQQARDTQDEPTAEDITAAQARITRWPTLRQQAAYTVTSLWASLQYAARTGQVPPDATALYGAWFQHTAALPPDAGPVDPAHAGDCGCVPSAPGSDPWCTAHHDPAEAGSDPAPVCPCGATPAHYLVAGRHRCDVCYAEHLGTTEPGGEPR